jgi:hypothetical protein
MVAIGVSGHREFANITAVSDAVDSVFDHILDSFGENISKVISPLAEGADRLVATCAIENYSAQLIAPLPFELSEYMLDFRSNSSKKEFTNLIKLANKVIQLPDEDTRNAGYLAAGMYTLDQSDVLIAIWDGRPARGIGGTGQIVAEARKQGKPMAWIQVPDRDEGSSHGFSNDSNEIHVTYERFPNTKIDKVESL